MCQTRRDQCHLNTFSTTTYRLSLNMGSRSIFSGGEKVTVLSQDSAVLDLKPGQKITVTGKLVTGDLSETVLESVKTVRVVS